MFRQPELSAAISLLLVKLKYPFILQYIVSYILSV